MENNKNYILEILMQKEIGVMLRIMFRQCGKWCKKKTPRDYVIATGKQYSVKEFTNLVLKELKIKFKWIGKGINSKCYNDLGKCIIECDKKYFRPLEVDTLLGDSSKARKELKWKPKYKINDLVKEMVYYENLNLTKRWLNIILEFLLQVIKDWLEAQYTEN